MLVALTGSDQTVEYRPQAQSFVTHRIGSTEAAERDLAFTAQTPLVEGLKQVIEWRKQDQKRATPPDRPVGDVSEGQNPPSNQKRTSAARFVVWAVCYTL